MPQPAPTVLFFNRNQKYGLDILQFDLLLSESHSRETEATGFAIEDGSTVTDHLEKKLITGGVTGLISNFSLLQGAAITNRAQDAFDILDKAHEDEWVGTMATSLRTYENVYLANFDAPMDSTVGESLVFNITFSQLKIVKFKTVKLDIDISLKDLKTNKRRRVARKKSVGKTQPSEFIPFSPLSGGAA